MGVECACVPSFAVHLMFLSEMGSKESGRPCSAETMFRDQASPHWGWSEANVSKLQHPTTNIQRNPKAEIRRPKAEGRTSNTRIAIFRAKCRAGDSSRTSFAEMVFPVSANDLRGVW